MSTRIEPKTYDVARAARTLFSALSGAEKRELTVADAATLTGLPLGDCEAALIHLGGELESRIRTTERGELLFTFASLTRKRRGAHHGVAAVRRKLRSIADTAIAVLTYLVVPHFVLAASANVTALVLVVRSLHFLLQIPLLPPVAIVALLLFAVGFLGVAVTQVLPVIFITLLFLSVALPIFVLVEAIIGGQPCILLAELVLVPICVGLARMMLPLVRDVASGARHIASPAEVERIKGIWREASGFVLGPEPHDPDGLDDERRVVAFLRQHDGILTTADLMALFGSTRAEAESESTRILADYGGQIEVSDDGALVFRFDALMQTAGAPAKDSDLRPAWEREAPPAFFGCSKAVSRNVMVVVAMAVLGLWLHPALVLFPTRAYYAAVDIGAAEPIGLLEGFGAWPFVLPMLVLASRVPFHLLARHTHAMRTQRHALLRFAFGPNDARVIAPDTKTLVSLGGEVVAESTDAEGRFRVAFPVIASERRAAAASRKGTARPRSSIGEVIFDTDLDRA